MLLRIIDPRKGYKIEESKRPPLIMNAAAAQFSKSLFIAISDEYMHVDRRREN